MMLYFLSVLYISTNTVLLHSFLSRTYSMPYLFSSMIVVLVIRLSFALPSLTTVPSGSLAILFSIKSKVANEGLMYTLLEFFMVLFTFHKNQGSKVAIIPFCALEIIKNSYLLVFPIESVIPIRKTHCSIEKLSAFVG